MHIRKAERKDLSRIAEIFVFNNRTNFFPIFKDPEFSFKELQVVPLVDHYFGKEEILNTIYVYDDGLIKGFIQISGLEICKLYIDTFFSKRRNRQCADRICNPRAQSSHPMGLGKK